ncbi:MAG: hypothetical protein RLZZ69_2640, partial [Cyanobacteriota bacterium]
MTEHQKTIESLLRDLNTASKLVDGVAQKSKSLENHLDRSRFVREIGKTLVHIFDLEADLFDIEPRLTFDQLRPSLDPIDLNTSLERLLSENRDIYESTIQEFKTHMLDKIASRFETACEAGTEYEFAQRW